MKRTALGPAGLALLFLGACATNSARLPEASSVARVYLESAPGQAGTEVVLPVSGIRLTVDSAPVLIETDLAAVAQAHVDLGDCMALHFKSAAAVDLLRLSTAVRGRRLVLTVDGAVIGVRRMDVTISDGEFLMFVELPSTELPGLVRRLQRGIGRLAQASPAKL